ncbi:uncharacterized protein K460DRAFT_148946 [Cucurbitaria berberidis CBS 394.84]|uniref:Uncharacterized protein n=1 Tax=Cucurbitaria berberidis CBS 394.84 TaxID=1168544 RepID=A0A9P4L6C1_9PLEO|nr:uncharacterized protein K460DRAFT_148946 [Cucurbitaria berberidis CBS 394.84]KAF1843650.1 hypothetical protein K460DRAFT_148946 [Cucurbitaria berberidis CBS 394.84]
MTSYKMRQDSKATETFQLTHFVPSIFDRVEAGEASPHHFVISFTVTSPNKLWLRCSDQRAVVEFQWFRLQHTASTIDRELWALYNSTSLYFIVGITLPFRVISKQDNIHFENRLSS